MSSQLHKFPFRALGGENEVQLYADDAAAAQAAADEAIGVVLAIEAKYSRYRPDSVVTRINQAAGSHPIEVDAETDGLLDYAEHCFSVSGGLFDITAGILRRAWDFSAKRVPRRGEIEELLPLIDWRSVQRTQSSIFLPRAGMEIDFGGFGKEYAADRAAETLLARGFTHALVNLGGDIRANGPHAYGSPWSVGIAHPRKKGDVITSIALGTAAVTTSGDYERYFEQDGKRYCHILNPRTGYPVAGLQSVSVIGASCLVCGSFSSIAMLLGPREGQRFVEDSGLQYLIVDHLGRTLRP